MFSISLIIIQEAKMVGDIYILTEDRAAGTFLSTCRHLTKDGRILCKGWSSVQLKACLLDDSIGKIGFPIEVEADGKKEF